MHLLSELMRYAKKLNCRLHLQSNVLRLLAFIRLIIDVEKDNARRKDTRHEDASMDVTSLET